jgi:hydrogenase maturation protease
VKVVDFGICGFDLACALVAGWGGAVLVDAVQRGGAPGTLYVIEPEVPDSAGAAALEAHGLDPARVLGLARALGEVCPWLRLVGCEPLTLGSEEEPLLELSAVVAAAVDEAVALVESLVRQYLAVVD